MRSVFSTTLGTLNKKLTTTVNRTTAGVEKQLKERMNHSDENIPLVEEEVDVFAQVGPSRYRQPQSPRQRSLSPPIDGFTKSSNSSSQGSFVNLSSPSIISLADSSKPKPHGSSDSFSIYSHSSGQDSPINRSNISLGDPLTALTEKSSLSRSRSSSKEALSSSWTGPDIFKPSVDRANRAIKKPGVEISLDSPSITYQSPVELHKLYLDSLISDLYHPVSQSTSKKSKPSSKETLQELQKKFNNRIPTLEGAKKGVTAIARNFSPEQLLRMGGTHTEPALHFYLNFKSKVSVVTNIANGPLYNLGIIHEIMKKLSEKSVSQQPEHIQNLVKEMDSNIQKYVEQEQVEKRTPELDAYLLNHPGSPFKKQNLTFETTVQDLLYIRTDLANMPMGHVQTLRSDHEDKLETFYPRFPEYKALFETLAKSIDKAAKMSPKERADTKERAQYLFWGPPRTGKTQGLTDFFKILGVPYTLITPEIVNKHGGFYDALVQEAQQLPYNSVLLIDEAEKHLNKGNTIGLKLFFQPNNIQPYKGQKLPFMLPQTLVFIMNEAITHDALNDRMDVAHIARASDYTKESVMKVVFDKHPNIDNDSIKDIIKAILKRDQTVGVSLCKKVASQLATKLTSGELPANNPAQINEEIETLITRIEETEKARQEKLAQASQERHDQDPYFLPQQPTPQQSPIPEDPSKIRPPERRPPGRPPTGW